MARLGSNRRFAPTRVQASPSSNSNRVYPAGMAGGGDADTPSALTVATTTQSAAVSTSIRYMARTSRRRGGCCKAGAADEAHVQYIRYI